MTVRACLYELEEMDAVALFHNFFEGGIGLQSISEGIGASGLDDGAGLELLLFNFLALVGPQLALDIED